MMDIQTDRWMDSVTMPPFGGITNLFFIRSDCSIMSSIICVNTFCALVKNQTIPVSLCFVRVVGLTVSEKIL